MRRRQRQSVVASAAAQCLAAVRLIRRPVAVATDGPRKSKGRIRFAEIGRLLEVDEIGFTDYGVCFRLQNDLDGIVTVDLYRNKERYHALQMRILMGPTATLSEPTAGARGASGVSYWPATGLIWTQRKWLLGERS